MDVSTSPGEDKRPEKREGQAIGISGSQLQGLSFLVFHEIFCYGIFLQLFCFEQDD